MGVVLFSRRGFTLACVVFIYICEVIKAGVCCLCGRGISFVGVVFTSVSVVLPLRACYYLRRRGYNIYIFCSRAFTFVGVALPI